MPEFYEKEAVWVDDDTDLAFDFLLDGSADDEEVFIVDEDVGDNEMGALFIDDEDLNEDNLPMVVEEPVQLQGELIPGTDIPFEDKSDDQNVKETTWENDQDHGRFLAYVKDRMTKIPRHSGETIPGCERAKSFLKAIDNEISKAMRSDLDGVIDEQEIDALRREIENMIERLDKQIKKLKGKKKVAFDVRLFSNEICEKCNNNTPMWHNVAENKMVCMHCDAEELKNIETMEKTASTPVLNVYMSPFERAIVSTIINASVSGGKNIEETYMQVKNKYNLNPREELAIQQLIADYGYPIIKDRGLLNEPVDPASGSGVEWQTNYHA